MDRRNFFALAGAASVALSGCATREGGDKSGPPASPADVLKATAAAFAGTALDRDIVQFAVNAAAHMPDSGTKMSELDQSSQDCGFGCPPFCVYYRYSLFRLPDPDPCIPVEWLAREWVELEDVFGGRDHSTLAASEIMGGMADSRHLSPTLALRFNSAGRLQMSQAPIGTYQQYGAVKTR